MKHRFRTGQKVIFMPGMGQGAGPAGEYTIVRQMPERENELQYRVQSKVDGHERMVREGQLTAVN